MKCSICHLNSAGVQQYSYDKLPKLVGEVGYFENIGSIALSPNKYKVESLTASSIYKITKEK